MRKSSLLFRDRRAKGTHKLQQGNVKMAVNKVSCVDTNIVKIPRGPLNVYEHLLSLYMTLDSRWPLWPWSMTWMQENGYLNVSRLLNMFEMKTSYCPSVVPYLVCLETSSIKASLKMNQSPPASREIFDDLLKFSLNTEAILTKSNQKQYLLRKLTWNKHTHSDHIFSFHRKRKRPLSFTCWFHWLTTQNREQPTGSSRTPLMFCILSSSGSH